MHTQSCHNPVEIKEQQKMECNNTKHEWKNALKFVNASIHIFHALGIAMDDLLVQKQMVAYRV